MAVAPVARDAEPCSRHAAMSATELTLISFKPLIYQQESMEIVNIDATTIVHKVHNS